MKDHPRRLYQSLIRRWGEATDIIEFGSPPDTMTVAIWAPDRNCDVTTFTTLGMSEQRMRGAEYLAELTLGYRGRLSREDSARLAVFLANLTKYPFAYDLKLDWWESLKNPGPIPFFPHCTQILLAPSIYDDFSRFDPPHEAVKLLHVIPITPLEAHLIQDHGREGFLDYVKDEGVDLFAPRQDRVALK